MRSFASGWLLAAAGTEPEHRDPSVAGELFAGPDARAQVLDEEDEDDRGDDPGERRQEDEQRDLGCDRIVDRHRRVDDPERALGPGETARHDLDHLVGDLVGQDGGTIGLFAWTRTVRIRVTSLAMTRVFAASRSAGMSSSPLLERLGDDRRRRDQLGVGLDEQTCRAQRLGVGVDRADEQPDLGLVGRREPPGDIETGEGGDPRRDEQRPPPASRDREVARELHLDSSMKRARRSVRTRTSGLAAYHRYVLARFIEPAIREPARG